MRGVLIVAITLLYGFVPDKVFPPLQNGFGERTHLLAGWTGCKKQIGCQVVLSGKFYREKELGDMFTVNNTLSNEADFWQDFPNYPRVTNYWITDNGKTGEDAQLFLDLGCLKKVSGFLLKNTHNAGYNDRGTRDFSIFSRKTIEDPWTMVTSGELADARNVSLVPTETFTLPDAIIPARYIMFQIDSYYGLGGGLQYFSIIEEKGCNNYKYLGHNKSCKRNEDVYTFVPGKCDGWARMDLKSCKEKCNNNEAPPGCQSRQCEFVIWDNTPGFPPGWCQLATAGCQIIEDNDTHELWMKTC